MTVAVPHFSEMFRGLQIITLSHRGLAIWPHAFAVAAPFPTSSSITKHSEWCFQIRAIRCVTEPFQLQMGKCVRREKKLGAVGSGKEQARGWQII